MKCEIEVKIFLTLASCGILLHLDVQLFQHHMLNRLSFNHWIAVLPLSVIDIFWLSCLIQTDPLVSASIPPPAPQHLFFYFIFKLYNIVISFAKYLNESATGIHVFPILNPPPSSFPIPSLWVVPVHQPQASSIVHRTWTGNSFHTWYYICFNAILPNLPILSLSNRVHKTVLYISVSFAVLYTGLLLPSF